MWDDSHGLGQKGPQTHRPRGRPRLPRLALPSYSLSTAHPTPLSSLALTCTGVPVSMSTCCLAMCLMPSLMRVSSFFTLWPSSRTR